MGRASFIYYAATIALIALPIKAVASGDRYSMTDGNDYTVVCTSEVLPDKNFCLAYTAGIWRGLSVGEFASQMAADRKIDRTIFCTPKEVSLTQVRDVVLKYVNDHPATRHTDATTLIWRALFEAWPCARK